MARTGRTVLEELSDLPRSFHTPELRMDCADALKFEVVERVRERMRGRGEVNPLDGVRVTYPDGSWSLVRASNTGPILVLRFEAPSAARLQALREEVESVVREARAASGG
jgi:phosphomannomutase/phosphoglucomutase